MSTVLKFPKPQDYLGLVSELIDELRERTCGIGSEDDDDLPGYRFLPETRAELCQTAELLREALDLLESVDEREDPRWNGAYDRAHPDETDEALDAQYAREQEAQR